MKANLQVIDAMLAVVMQFTRAADPAIASAATDELQLLAKRRAALLRQTPANPDSPTPEGDGRKAALAA